MWCCSTGRALLTRSACCGGIGTTRWLIPSRRAWAPTCLRLGCALHGLYLHTQSDAMMLVESGSRSSLSMLYTHESLCVYMYWVVDIEQVTVDNSKDKRISDCMACQVLLYSKTNMLVGLHGAGKILILTCTCPSPSYLPRHLLQRSWRNTDGHFGCDTLSA